MRFWLIDAPAKIITAVFTAYFIFLAAITAINFIMVIGHLLRWALA